MTEQAETVEIYTDGSFLWPNQEGYKSPDRQGGWAYVFLANGKTLCASGLLGKKNGHQSSINRCEMWAIISALARLADQDYVTYKLVTVFSDSEYSVKMLRGDWIIKAHTKNRDMINAFNLQYKRLKAKGTAVILNWIPGHSGNKYNDMADELAGKRLKEAYGKSV